MMRVLVTVATEIVAGGTKPCQLCPPLAIDAHPKALFCWWGRGGSLNPPQNPDNRVLTTPAQRRVSMSEWKTYCPDSSR